MFEKVKEKNSKRIAGGEDILGNLIFQYGHRCDKANMVLGNYFLQLVRKFETNKSSTCKELLDIITSILARNQCIFNQERKAEFFYATVRVRKDLSDIVEHLYTVLNGETLSEDYSTFNLEERYKLYEAIKAFEYMKMALSEPYNFLMLANVTHQISKCWEFLKACVSMYDLIAYVCMFSECIYVDDDEWSLLCDLMEELWVNYTK